ncbi:MAG: S8 family serine peptidase [Gemmatimonadaceae bacterium]
MHRITARVTAATAILLAACGNPERLPLAPTTGGSAELRGQPATAYLVTFQDDVTDVRALANDMAMRGGFALDHVRLHAARGFTAFIPPAFVNTLRGDPRIKIIEPDGVVTLDLPRDNFGAQARPSQGQQTSYGLARVGGSADGSGRTAWIIDTGIDLEHPDLNTSRNCHASFVRRGSPDDGNGHGTHVAGIVAARNNSVGTLGVAANAFVCSVRVLDNSGSGQWSWIVAGIDYVAANGAAGEVANMSLGGSGSNATVEQAVLDASQNVEFVLAAGNNGEHASDFTPARVNGPNVYTISAIDSRDCMPSWSNFGNPPVDYAAPGVGILSTWRGGGTKSISGTSMAAPHVTGILLVGGVRSSGSAGCDPDGNPDPIASR